MDFRQFIMLKARTNAGFVNFLSKHGERKCIFNIQLLADVEVDMKYN